MTRGCDFCGKPLDENRLTLFKIPIRNNKLIVIRNIECCKECVLAFVDLTNRLIKGE